MTKGDSLLARFGARGQAATGAAGRKGGLAARRTYKVLAVDDDATARAAIEDVLTGEGYDVQTVGSYGDWERAWAGGAAHDLVILDVNLAERRGGYEILRALRKQDTAVPVLMLSARNTSTDTVFATANGASAYVSKVDGEFGHSTRGLVATVRRLLAQ